MEKEHRVPGESSAHEPNEIEPLAHDPSDGSWWETVHVLQPVTGRE
jgi:hypothetical protein